MAATVSFTDSSDSKPVPNTAVARLVRECSKGKLKIIPSESDKEDFEVSFVLTPDVSEDEKDSDSDDKEVFTDDNDYCSDERRKSIKCIARQETKSNLNGESFNCSYSWSVSDS